MKKSIKRHIRISALILALCMMMTVAACGGSSSVSSSSSSIPSSSGGAVSSSSTVPEPMPASEPNAFGDGVISREKITLTALVSSPGGDDRINNADGSTIWFFEELEKMTNIHVRFDSVAEADWSTKTNLMFSSGDYYDMILAAPIDVEEYGVAQGILVPLDDYIEEYMPNYYSRLYMNDANVSIPASDGKMYYIGKLIAQNVNHEPNFYINKTWLDELGLSVPKTIDELTDVLRAFRDNDANGNGDKKDELPSSFNTLNHYCNGIYPQFACFGVPLIDNTSGFGFVNILDNQKVVATPTMPGFRAAVEWLNLLYSEGLMDIESIAQDNASYIAKINEGRVGYTTHLRLINSGLTPEATDSYVSILPPTSAYDTKLPRVLEVPSFGAVLTKANKHIPETLQWLDRQMETEIMMIGYNGPISKEFGPTRRADGTVLEPTIKLNDEGKYEILYVPADNELYDYVPILRAQFFAPGDYYFNIYKMPPHRVERYNTSKEYDAAGILEKYSYDYLQKMSKLNNEDSIEIVRIHSEIKRLVEESVSNFITKGVTDASWDTFIKSLNNLGIDRYVSIYQKAYDDYLSSTK